ncbi:MAG: BatA and WFA domain-containing protein [Clostridiales bacterium]|nr:BatA and WFA domain-containing protein [Clostridiales bacterium]
MRFLYPLGFLGLIGIPVLVLVYIIKNRYTEKIISSTYIWTMSERFLKRRVPISKIANIISLILQILAVIFISFAITQPVIVIPGAAHSYCFVIDASGSMNITQNGKTRFDIAKERIDEMIDKSKNGSDYTLICMGGSDQMYENILDKKTAKQKLSELNVGYESPDAAHALEKAQVKFNKNPSMLIYLFTDKDYTQSDNVTVVNVAKDVDNYAIKDVSYEHSGSKLRITGTAVSYLGESDVTVQLYFDGESEKYDSKEVKADGAGAQFEFVCDKASFGFFTVALEGKDALVLDDEIVVYDVAYQNISDILLVSDSPFFMRAALASVGINKVDFKTTDEYEGNTGYGLYIFDTFMPEKLPEDGAVWFIDPKSTLAGTNFSFQGEVAPRTDANYSTSTESMVMTLLDGIVDATDKIHAYKSFTVNRYDKCRLNGKFYELAYCDGDTPILFAGTNAYGNREAVFAFDIHNAQLALLGDLPLLVKNLINFSFPTTIIAETNYYCGDTVLINAFAACTDIRIELPSGARDGIIPSETICEYKLTEVGVYKIVLVMKDKSERSINVFASLPETERSPFTMGSVFSITGTPETEFTDGLVDILLYIFIILAVLAVADYGLYCYEQYQLR